MKKPKAKRKAPTQRHAFGRLRIPRGARVVDSATVEGMEASSKTEGKRRRRG